MPPEHDDIRERQLAALRRYVSDLDVRRRHDGDQLPPGEPRRRLAGAWVLLTLLLMAVSLAGGIAIGNSRDSGADRPAGDAAATSTAAAAAPTAAPECAEAVERANQSISYAVRVSGALREHTEIMNNLLNGRINTETALRTGTPSLIVGSAEAAKFDVALADYRKVVDRCQLRAP